MEPLSENERPRTRGPLDKQLHSDDKVAAHKPERNCQAPNCGKPLGLSRRSNARYCLGSACNARAFRKRRGAGGPERRKRQLEGLAVRHDAQAAATARRDLDKAGLMRDESARMVPRVKRRHYHESGLPKDAAFDYRALEGSKGRISELRLHDDLKKELRRSELETETFPCRKCGGEVNIASVKLEHQCEESMTGQQLEELKGTIRDEVRAGVDEIVGLLVLDRFGETPADAAERILGETITEQY